MGLLSNRLDRDALKPGDHIYSWRRAYSTAHHGIYIGDNQVINFELRGPQWKTRSLFDIMFTCFYTCIPPTDCRWVHLSSLDRFLAGGILCRFEYAVTPGRFLAQARGGTCTFAVSDADDLVVHRAKYLLDNGSYFGCYNIFKNNCEDFALYCKTGLLVLERRTMGQSGQAASLIGGSLAVVLYRLLVLVTTNVYWRAATFVGVYCASRYVADIGMRRDVVKVPVEDLTRRLPTCIHQVFEPSLQAVPAAS